MSLLGAQNVPADVYFGLALMAVVFVAGLVMTVMVLVRNRSAGHDEHPDDGPGPSGRELP